MNSTTPAFLETPKQQARATTEELTRPKVSLTSRESLPSKSEAGTVGRDYTLPGYFFKADQSRRGPIIILYGGQDPTKTKYPRSS